jgi:hypothetical protein
MRSPCNHPKLGNEEHNSEEFKKNNFRKSVCVCVCNVHMLPNWCIVGLANSWFCMIALTKFFRIVILCDKGVAEIKNGDK